VYQNDEVQGSVPNFWTWADWTCPHVLICGPHGRFEVNLSCTRTFFYLSAILGYPGWPSNIFGFLGPSPWEMCFSNFPRSENRQQRQIVHRALHYSSLWMASGWQRSFAADSFSKASRRRGESISAAILSFNPACSPVSVAAAGDDDLVGPNKRANPGTQTAIPSGLDRSEQTRRRQLRAPNTLRCPGRNKLGQVK
jgi:hypothetical protein